MADQISKLNPPGARAKFFISFLVLFGIAFIFYWALAAQMLDLSLPELTRHYKNMLFYPNMNLFVVGEIDGHNVLTLFYYFLAFVLLMTGGYFMLFIYDPHKTPTISFQQTISAAGLTCLLIFSGIQQMHRTDYFRHEQASFKQKSPADKYAEVFGGLYTFSQTSQDLLVGRHQGDMLTDFNLSDSPYMFHHRALSYFFYPKLSMRFDNQTPKDVLFLYHKTNPFDHVPENYKILLKSDDDSFILAVKERP